MSRIYFNPDLHAEAMVDAHLLSDQLSSGDPSSLPESILLLLLKHIESLDMVDIDDARRELMAKTVPPFDEEKAIKLGHAVRSFIDTDERTAPRLIERDSSLH